MKAGLAFLKSEWLIPGDVPTIRYAILETELNKKPEECERGVQGLFAKDTIVYLSDERSRSMLDSTGGEEGGSFWAAKIPIFSTLLFIKSIKNRENAFWSTWSWHIW